ncbi:PepSY domain-containing protein [Psychrobacillus sp. FSL K6-2843]|uniref:PepSY domain-containing protein n=1 Tax=Psychrobacillus sp. FSL K6-2843 TaxID=2921549 RepID=UPI0011AA43B4
MSFYVYILVLKDRQILFFKLFITFTAILVVLVIVFELTKPNYTYNEAKGIIEKEYNVTVVETEVKSILDRDIDKEVYKITALKDSQRLVFTFNPYSKEIFILK